jgi:hypothetical protein
LGGTGTGIRSQSGSQKPRAGMNGIIGTVSSAVRTSMLKSITMRSSPQPPLAIIPAITCADSPSTGAAVMSWCQTASSGKNLGGTGGRGPDGPSPPQAPSALTHTRLISIPFMASAVS